MGRPKGYDRDAVLEKAMELFWRQGYEGTSTQQLVEHLGINRNSMYSEFGNKRAFFEQALRHYEHLWIGRNFGPLEGPAAGPDDIVRLFDHYAEAGKGRRSGMGCMLANATVEMGARDEASRRISHDFTTRAAAAFENALRGGQGRGELRPEVDPRTHARFLTSVWLGLLVLYRGKAEDEMLDAIPSAVREHLDGLRPEVPTRP